MQALCQGAQICSRNLDGLVLLGLWIPNTLLLNIHAELALGSTVGVAAVVTRARLLAGFDASACHESALAYGRKARLVNDFAGISAIRLRALQCRPMSSFLNPTFIIAILVAITVHEWAHAYAAYRLGDNTAKYAGRLTLNPLAHLDPLGALMFVVVGFGWAKPVPVDPRNLRNYKWGNTLVALAGPVSNLIVATIAMVLLEILGRHTSNSPMSLLSAQGDSTAMTLAIQLLTSSIFVNLGLMAFNLLPIAPLDGSKILEPFIPLHLQDLYDEAMRRGPMILILLLVAEHFVGIPIISGWVMGIMEFVLTGFVLITTIIPAS